ncbi:MAG: hypothetical protein JRJ68_03695 [Deltaproteobacteria bacterium]|nr:hypothetical protein [Deltaproteobacteria bacterium]
MESKAASDLSILEGLAALAHKHSCRLRAYDPIGIVDQFKRTLLRELDYTYERRNIEQFSCNFTKDQTVQFPKTFPEYSSKRVLTMEFLPGTSGLNKNESRDYMKAFVGLPYLRDVCRKARSGCFGPFVRYEYFPVIIGQKKEEKEANPKKKEEEEIKIYNFKKQGRKGAT